MSRQTSLRTDAFLDVARQAALKAGKILMRSYGKLSKSQISTKAKNDFVTVIDKESERAVLAHIRKHFPDHGIQAEESGLQTGPETYWVIDPLDGTSNYIHEIPMFSVSIAVCHRDQVVAGVVYDPLHKQMYTARRGKGAYLNGRKLSVTGTTTLSDSLVATGIPFRARARFKDYIRSLERISLGSIGLRRGGSAALDLVYVAAGRFDGFWELDLSPWDVAAGAILIEEAGGRVTDMWGKPDYLRNGDVLATNGRIHHEMLKITKAVLKPTHVDKSYPYASSTRLA